jgi:hypothetical protein
VFTDPPYNVAIDGHVCGLGRIKHDNFVMAAGEMTEAEFTAFLRTALKCLTEHSVDGALHFVCMGWRHAFELWTAARGNHSLKVLARQPDGRWLIVSEMYMDARDEVTHATGSRD